MFTRTKHGANRLCQQLQGAGIRAAAIHGNKSQARARARPRATSRKARVTALVATEVAARGLDIKELPYVVNYELPNVPEDYVHRIGRTARAGGSGAAVSLVAPDEAPLLRDIEQLLKRTLPVQRAADVRDPRRVRRDSAREAAPRHASPAHRTPRLRQPARRRWRGATVTRRTAPPIPRHAPLGVASMA